ncbi:MAG: hypothetical protein HRT68_15355 [Flavobacteriaceae bacterium]|nr:hypothetical protein [Flavobacteriaceae bacterium]
MEPAAYTLIGALGGIFITQMANYFLEDKKSANQIKLKELELKKVRYHELLKERQEAYFKYLEEVDKFYAQENRDDMVPLVSHLYKSVLVASDATAAQIRVVFNILRDEEFEDGNFLKAKKELLDLMRKDLQE